MFLIDIFNTILYQPFFNALILLYEYFPLHDFGIAIILLTIIIRLILYPLMGKSIEAQKAMAELQPKVQVIQKKYEKDREKQAREVMALYQKEKVSPLGGCLPLLVQLPIFIALFLVLKDFGGGLDKAGLLYSFVSMPAEMPSAPLFLGIMNLSLASFPLAVIVGITQLIQSKMLSFGVKKDKNEGGKEKDSMAQMTGMMQGPMLYFFSFFAAIVCLQLPSAISLYWVTNNLFSIVQQKIILSRKKIIIPNS
ncbi:hypothetical protein BWK69_00235 [Candidatus Parcubacteria bacterium A4]|nr:MAG: hypothetical protein BWK69_00235 [Candidatus Parcubacteria bacterium A4]